MNRTKIVLVVVGMLLMGVTTHDTNIFNGPGNRVIKGEGNRADGTSNQF